jgi:hypothetical protein
VELDADDLAAIADVKSKGYRYFSRKLPDAEQAAIGSIAPKRIDAPAGEGGVPSPPVCHMCDPPPPTTAGGGGGGATASPAASSPATDGGSGSPAPPAAGAGGGGGAAAGIGTSSGKLSAASAWNGAATFEERNLTTWARGRLKELLAEGRASGALAVPVPGVGRAIVTGIKGWGASSCDIVISRGKARHIYDIRVKFIVRIVPEADAAGAAVDVTEDEEAEAKKDDAPGAPAPAPAPASGGSTSPAAGDKFPCGYLVFRDFSNDTEPSGDADAAAGHRPRTWEWGIGKQAVPAGQRDAVSGVVTPAGGAAAGGAAGLAAAVEGVLERLVAEFRAK